MLNPDFLEQEDIQRGEIKVAGNPSQRETFPLQRSLDPRLIENLTSTERILSIFKLMSWELSSIIVDLMNKSSQKASEAGSYYLDGNLILPLVHANQRPQRFKYSKDDEENISEDPDRFRSKLSFPDISKGSNKLLRIGIGVAAGLSGLFAPGLIGLNQAEAGSGLSVANTATSTPIDPQDITRCPVPPSEVQMYGTQFAASVQDGMRDPVDDTTTGVVNIYFNSANLQFDQYGYPNPFRNPDKEFYPNKQKDFGIPLNDYNYDLAINSKVICEPNGDLSVGVQAGYADTQSTAYLYGVFNFSNPDYTRTKAIQNNLPSNSNGWNLFTPSSADNVYDESTNSIFIRIINASNSSMDGVYQDTLTDNGMLASPAVLVPATETSTTTASPTPSVTASPSPTETPTETDIPTKSPTETRTPTQTVTFTATPMVTETPLGSKVTVVYKVYIPEITDLAQSSGW